MNELKQEYMLLLGMFVGLYIKNGKTMGELKTEFPHLYAKIEAAYKHPDPKENE